MRIKSYTLEKNEVSGVCKSPSLWLNMKRNKGHCTIPVIYFKRPKHIPKDKFSEIIDFIELNIPMDFEMEE